MKIITSQKPFEEIRESLQWVKKVFLIGCGNCATMCHTGGVEEIHKMKGILEGIGIKVSGWMVPPVGCDDLTKDAIKENEEALKEAEAILVMSCAFGLNTITSYTDKPVYPAVNTIFIGKEVGAGHYSEVCIQCGECVLAMTGGICPVTTCPKGLLNGPCGGTNDGKCEVSPDIECAWVRIYKRLKGLDRLDDLKRTIGAKDWSKGQIPGSYKVKNV